MQEYPANIQFKAALTNIFIIAMNQITVCNMKVVIHNNEPTDYKQILCSSPQLCGAFLCLSALQPTTLLFSLTALIFIVSSSFFQRKSSDKPTHHHQIADKQS